jgi:hypothetical protein
MGRSFLCESVVLPGRTRSETRELETVTILPGRTRSQTREWNRVFQLIERVVDKAFLPLFRRMDKKELIEALRTVYAQEKEL